MQMTKEEMEIATGDITWFLTIIHQEGDKNEICHRKLTADTDVETSQNDHDIVT
jgi:hypothetical protein